MTFEEPTIPAIVILAHGSPDPDWSAPIVAIRQRMQELDPLRTIVDAYMAHSEPGFDDAIDQLVVEGHRTILVLAAFLSPGGNHIKRDLPAMVDAARSRHPKIEMVLYSGALGQEPEVIEGLARAAFRRIFHRGPNGE